MFGFPYYENDEATYISRAWSFITTGELDVYTYRYDHAPLGWIIMGFWLLISGGTLIFNSLLESGRVLMLLVDTVSTVLLYVIVKRFTGGSKLAGFLAAMFFSVSPLAIYFQRRILLDNLMVLAFLISIYYLTKEKLRLKDHIMSAVALGAAVLIKMNAIFLTPAFLYLAWRRADKKHVIHVLSHWVMFYGLVIGLFFIYALLKGELFSAPIGPDGMPEHVSVIDTFGLQLGRGEFAWPWDPESSFRQTLDSWQLKDNFSLVLGALSTIGALIIGFIERKKNPYFLFAGSLSILYLLFLVRGGIVLDLYVAPHMPLLAINVGIFFGYIANRFTTVPRYILSVGIIAILGWVYAFQLPTRHLYVDETTNQHQAIEWISENVPRDATIVGDNYVYPSLTEEHGFENVYYFFNAEYDPDVKDEFDDDWRNVDYMVVTHEVIQQIYRGQIPTMQQMFDRSTLVADFTDNASSFIDLDNYISTNGDWAQVYQVKSRNDIVLQDSWDYFVDEFVRDYGQVVDTSNGMRTTSNDQALAMLQAVDEDDEAMFSGFWQWSQDHLRHRQDDGLLSWLWDIDDDGNYSLSDSNTLCGADQKIILALVRASNTWGVEAYMNDAESVMSDWWSNCVFQRGGQSYVASSADGSIDNILLNPGYFDPALYREISQAFPNYNWQRIIDDGYIFLDQLLDEFGFIPNWVVLTENNQIISASDLIAGADTFGQDSLQLVFALVEDYVKHSRDESAEILERIASDTAAYYNQNTQSSQAITAVLVLAQTNFLET
jgi:endo-1,4-beta-D-glucanase Y